METFFIVVVMLVTQQYPTEDLYIYKEPTFSNVRACIDFVQTESQGLVASASNAYQGRGVENIYCAEQKALQRLLDEMENATGDVAV